MFKTEAYWLCGQVVVEMTTELERGFLESGRHFVLSGNLSPALSGTSLADIAEEAGLSVAAVSRSIRSKDRLEDRTLEYLTAERTTSYCAVQLWGAQRSSERADRSTRGGRAVVQALSEMKERQSDVVPLTGIWGFVDSPHVARQLADSNHFLFEVFQTSIGASLKERGRRLGAPFTLEGLVASTYCYASGAMALSDIIGESPGFSPIDSGHGLNVFVGSVTECGEMPDPVPAVGRGPIRGTPDVLPNEVPVVAAAVRLLSRRGLPGPIEHFTARNLAKASGASVGSVYRLWNSIDAYHDALLIYVFDCAHQELLEDLAIGRPVHAALGSWLAAAPAPLLFRCAASRRTVDRDLLRCHVADVLESLSVTPVVQRAAGDDARVAAVDLVAFVLGAQIFSRFESELSGWSSGFDVVSIEEVFCRLRLSVRWGGGPDLDQ